jgi:hypothetical protein
MNRLGGKGRYRMRTDTGRNREPIIGGILVGLLAVGVAFF